VKLGIRPTKALPLALVEEVVGLDEPQESEVGSEDAAEQMEFAAVAEESSKRS
jgi:hypothetical protein